jgi:hypothetical protein
MVINGLQGEREREAETNTQILLRQETHEIKHRLDGNHISVLQNLGIFLTFRRFSLPNVPLKITLSSSSVSALMLSPKIRFSRFQKFGLPAPFLTEGSVTASLTVFFLGEISSYV